MNGAQSCIGHSVVLVKGSIQIRRTLISRYDKSMAIQQTDSLRTGTDPIALARERLIVALDVPDSDSAIRLVEQLNDSCSWFKVGLELFVAAGPAIVEKIVASGKNVFLDL